MYLLPCGAQLRKIVVQDLFDAVELASAEAIVTSQADRPSQTIQIEGRVPLRANDVHVCGPMVVRKNDYA
jgi:hypothetical protein